MKQFTKRAIRDWRSLNNQNDPTAIELMRRNKKRYGVPVTTQFRHALNAFWLLPLVFVLSRLGEMLKPMGWLGIGIWLFAIVWGIKKLVDHMEDTDPVEKAKQDAKPAMPQLKPGVRYHNEIRDGRVVIVDEDGHALA